MPGSTSTSSQLFSEPTKKKRQYSKKAALTAENMRTQKHEPLDTMHVHKELAAQGIGERIGYGHSNTQTY
jgi:hypothetical protein